MSTRVDSIVSAMVGPDPDSSKPILDALADCIGADAVTVDGVEHTCSGEVWNRENNKMFVESYNGLPGARISKVSKENPDALILVEWSQEAGCWEVGWQLYRAGEVIAEAEWEGRLVPAISVPDLAFVKAAFDGAADTAEQIGNEVQRLSGRLSSAGSVCAIKFMPITSEPSDQRWKLSIEFKPGAIVDYPLPGQLLNWQHLGDGLYGFDTAAPVPLDTALKTISEAYPDSLVLYTQIEERSVAYTYWCLWSAGSLSAAASWDCYTDKQMVLPPAQFMRFKREAYRESYSPSPEGKP